VAHVLNFWQVFSLHCSSSLNYVNEYLTIDSEYTVQVCE